MRRWLYALVAAAALAALAAGCGPPSGALIKTLAPREEALGYFPADAPAVALVRTDAAWGEIVAALPARSHGRLARLARSYGLAPGELDGLRGNELVVGLPRPGSPWLAALVARDAGRLGELVGARVAAGHARLLGSYRGAALYRGRRHALAVRGAVLLVSRDAATVRDALDRRASDAPALGHERVGRALPDWRGPKPVVRAAVDGAGLVAALGPRARAVPWLAAWERLGVVVQARGGELVATLRLGTAADELVERDLPVPPGPRAPRAVPGDGVSVRDFAHLVGVADRAAAEAFPLERLRVEHALRALKLSLEDLAGRLHGPATLVLRPRGWAVRVEATRPRALAPVVARLARRLPKALGPRYAIARTGPVHSVRRGRRTVVRFGLLRGAFVFGATGARELRALAAARTRRVRGARGGLTVSLSGAGLRRELPQWAGWRVDGWLRASPSRLTGELRIPLG